MFKRLFTNTVIYVVGPQIPRLASLFVLPIITKDLSTTDYGIYGIIAAYVGILGGIKDMGVVVNMSNLFFRYPSRWQTGWRQLHGYVLLWSIVFSAIQSTLLYFIIPVEAKEFRFEIILLHLIPALFFDTTIMFGSRFYQISERPFYMGISSAIVGATTIVLNLVTISYLKMGYMGWFVSTCLGTGLSFLFYFFPLYFKYKLTPIFKIRKRFLINQLKVALPIIPHNYSSYLLNVSDRLVMNVLGINVSQIGVYNIAYTFGNYIDFAGGALGMAISPIYTKLYSIRREADVRTLTFVLQALFLFGSFLLCLWLKEVFIFLIKNNELQNGYSLAIIVIMGFNYRPMYWAVGLKISYYEMTKYLWRFSFVAGIVNIALNFILIPIYGYQVAAVTSFIGMMYIGFSGFFLSSYRKLENDKFYPIAWMALITGLSFLVYLLRDIEVFSKALVSLFLSVVLVSGFFRFKKEILKISI